MRLRTLGLIVTLLGFLLAWSGVFWLGPTIGSIGAGLSVIGAVLALVGTR